MLETLLLPIEIAARELDGKLLLGLMAAERGMRVRLGRRQDIDSPVQPRGIYLAKNVRGGFVLDKPEALGHSIVALDEEGLVRFEDPVQNMRIEQRSLKLPRLLFAWGPDNADYWRRLAVCDDGKIIEAGNPRGDLLRPELRDYYSSAVQSIQSRFGQFVLINTNFSMVNHFWRGHTSFRKAAGADPQTFSTVWAGLRQHKLSLFHGFQDLIGPLATAIHPAKLVIRPHPSEDPEPWQRLAERHDNVSVVSEGGVVPWLMAASCLVQNGCTTSVEAALVGTPSIAFRPVRSDIFDLALPNSVARQAGTVADVIDAARAALYAGDTGDRAHVDRLLDRHLSSIRGDFACERILDSIWENRAALAQPRDTGIKTKFKAGVRMVVDTIADWSVERRYNSHVYPPIDPVAVQRKVLRFTSLLRRFGSVQTTVLPSGVVELSAT
ncbi:MAG: surface carbohydrate biosynthesis protein [Hyphomicrobiales bacterium]